MNIALSDVGKHISDETKTSKIVISLFAKHFFFVRDDAALLFIYVGS